MSPKSSLPWLVFSFTFISLSVLLLVSERAPAQTSEPSSERASLSMEQEHHHHLEFENSYVRVFFVEIPAHESTLFHRHDFPYLSVPPTGADAAMPPTPGSPGQETGLPMIGYSPGNFSHAVSNSRDFVLRNVAIELLHAQGATHDRCEQVIHDQPKEGCDILKANMATPATRTPLFETDEILVEAWQIIGRVTTPPWHDPTDVLLASLSGVSVTAPGGIDSANALKGGLLWVPAGSRPIFKTDPAGDAHFIVITFKDSSSPSGSHSF